MPILKPGEDEKQKEFISRCMANEAMLEEFPDKDQRAAVCYDSWRKVKGGKKPEEMSNKEYREHRKGKK